MQIQLKQVEIVAALEQYIARKGIDLNGKSVAITFTAGRKNSTGLSADMVIEDAAIPGFSDATEDPSTHVNQVNQVNQDSKPVLSVVAKPSVPEDSPASPVEQEGKAATPAEDAAPVVAGAAESKATVSLFN
jgi:hypothetical protein